MIVEGDDLDGELALALDTAYGEIRELQSAAREGQPARAADLADADRALAQGLDRHPRARRHPASRAPPRPTRCPRCRLARNPEHLQALEDWLRSYGPEELFDESGGPAPEIAADVPDRRAAHGRQPPRQRRAHARRAAAARARRSTPSRSIGPAARPSSSLGALGGYLGHVFELNREQSNFRIVCPDEVASNRLGALFEVENHAYEWPVDPEISPDYKPDGRIMEVLSEHNCQGWLQGYVLTGRHGVFPCYEAFIPIVDGMVNQYGKFLKMSREEAPWREPVASLNYLLTSEGWRQDHNGYSHQMPGFINSMLNRREEHARVYVPPDANTLLATMDHCLQATGCINLVIGSKLPAAAVALDGRGP